MFRFQNILFVALFPLLLSGVGTAVAQEHSDTQQRFSSGGHEGNDGRENREGREGNKGNRGHEGNEGYKAERGDLCLMWYNVENLFHPSDDSLAGDDEFTPAGVRGWSYRRYYQKLTSLARVIVAAGRWQPPGVVGLCEVEGPQVLEDLVSHSILAPYHYSYIHRDGPDHRGMDVACLFRPERVTPLSWEFFSPAQREGMDQTREMLHLRGLWGRKDTLDLIFVHFISRYRGAGVTATYRREQAKKLSFLIDSLGNRSPTSLVVVGGDFNDSRDAWSLEPLSYPPDPSDPSDLASQNSQTSSVSSTSYVSITSLPSEEFPSYKYRGVWSSIDFFLVSGAVFPYKIRGTVFNNPRLLMPDLSYGGEKPNRTYVGYSYAGGYSDHLPVLLDISRSPFY
jgi:hypothetical protein